MSFARDCAKTFAKCLAAGSGQMIGIAIGTAGVRVAGKLIADAVEKVKNSKAELPAGKPYRRVTTRTIESEQ